MYEYPFIMCADAKAQVWRSEDTLFIFLKVWYCFLETRYLTNLEWNSPSNSRLALKRPRDTVLVSAVLGL